MPAVAAELLREMVPDNDHRHYPAAREWPVAGCVGARPPRVGFKKGLNRLAWDLRYDGSVVFPGMIMWAATPQRGQPWFVKAERAGCVLGRAIGKG